MKPAVLEMHKKKLAIYLVYDGLCIKKEQFNGGVILQVGYTLYVEPENTEENINTPAASKWARVFIDLQETERRYIKECFLCLLQKQKLACRKAMKTKLCRCDWKVAVVKVTRWGRTIPKADHLCQNPFPSPYTTSPQWLAVIHYQFVSVCTFLNVNMHAHTRRLNVHMMHFAVHHQQCAVITRARTQTQSTTTHRDAVTFWREKHSNPLLAERWAGN